MAPMRRAGSLSTIVPQLTFGLKKILVLGQSVSAETHSPNAKSGAEFPKECKMTGAIVAQCDVYKQVTKENHLATKVGISNTNRQPQKQAQLFILAWIQVQKLQAPHSGLK